MLVANSSAQAASRLLRLRLLGWKRGIVTSAAHARQTYRTVNRDG
jgi:hypothetical protein